jgi:hypothetical protein
MAGDADLVEQAVQLADDGGDLLGEVAGVHVGCGPASGVVGRVCTVTAQCSGARRRRSRVCNACGVNRPSLSVDARAGEQDPSEERWSSQELQSKERNCADHAHNSVTVRICGRSKNASRSSANQEVMQS